MRRHFCSGAEVGFYQGCVHTWRQLQKLDSAVIPERAAKGLAALEELLANFPLDDPQVRLEVAGVGSGNDIVAALSPEARAQRVAAWKLSW